MFMVLKLALEFSLLVCDTVLISSSIYYNIEVYMSLLMKNMFLPYANNKGADQPANPRSLISTFVVHYVDSIIPLVSIPQISSLYLSFCGCAGRFESYPVANPEDRFSHDVAHMVSL